MARQGRLTFGTAAALLRTARWDPDAALSAYLSDPRGAHAAIGAVARPNVDASVDAWLAAGGAVSRRDRALGAATPDRRPSSAQFAVGRDQLAARGVAAPNKADEVRPASPRPAPPEETPGSTSGAAPTPTAECPVCWEDVHPAKLFSLPCGHGVCLRCWRSHLATSLQTEGSSCVSLRCPAAPCSQVVDEETWSLLCPPPELARYRQFLLESFVERSLHLRFCSNPRGCNLAIRYTGPKRDVQCACGHRMCFACSGDAHWPLPCAMMEAWRRRADADGAAARWLLGNTKRCPQCRVHIEKNEGCLHMTCARCRHQFCWNCKRPWSTHGANTGGYYRCNLYDPQRHVERYDDLPRPADGVAARAVRRLQLGTSPRADDAASRDASLHRYMHFLDRYETQGRAVERLSRLQRHARTEHDRVQQALEAAVGASHRGGATPPGAGSAFQAVSSRWDSAVEAGEEAEEAAAGLPHAPESMIARLRRALFTHRLVLGPIGGGRAGDRAREGAPRDLTTRELAWTAAAAERVSDAAASLTECFSVLRNSFIFLYFLPDDVRSGGKWGNGAACLVASAAECFGMPSCTLTPPPLAAGAFAAVAGVQAERPCLSVRARA